MLVHAWSALPSDLKPLLLLGDAAGARLAELATRALQGLSLPLAPTVAAARLRLGREALLAAWEREPLNGALAGQLLALQAKLPWLPAALLPVLGAVAEQWRQPAELRYFERLLEHNDLPGQQRYLDAQLRREPENLFWRCEALRAAARAQSQDVDWPAQDCPPNLPPALRARLEADALFLAGEYEAAASRYQAAEAQPLAAARRAEALARAGRAVQSLIPVWRPLLASGAWRTGLLLRAYELFVADSAPLSTPDPDGPIDLLVHTRNAAQDLDATLAGLAASQGWRRLVVLDRGSTDATPETLRRWGDQLGQERLTLVATPVDIGAPAARNWLLRRPETQDAVLLAFVEDRALVPTDWLPRLLQARGRTPRAAVWGCRVLDHAGRPLDAERGLAPAPLLPEQAPDELWALQSDLRRAQGRPFELSSAREELADFGQFDYSRPCLGTSGACRLYDADRLREAGGFNLQFAPGGLEDAERDLRQALKGDFACYQGLLAVRLAKPGAEARRLDKQGVELANRYKLLRLFDQEQIQALRRRQDELYEQDLSPKLARLDAVFFGKSPDRNAI